MFGRLETHLLRLALRHPFPKTTLQPPGTGSPPLLASPSSSFGFGPRGYAVALHPSLRPLQVQKNVKPSFFLPPRPLLHGASSAAVPSRSFFMFRNSPYLHLQKNKTSRCSRALIENAFQFWRSDAKALRRPFSVFSRHAQSSATETIEQTLHRYKELEDYMRIRGWNTLRIVLSVLAASVAGLYYFRREIEKPIVEKANELTKDIVQANLNDPQVIENAFRFLESVLSKPETQKVLISLVNEVLSNPKTQAVAHQLVAAVIRDISQDEATLQFVVTMLSELLVREETKKAAIELLKNVFYDEYMLQLTAEFFGRVVKASYFTEPALETSQWITHSILDDPNIKAHTTTFLSDCISDRKLQEQSSTAMWEVVTGAVVPKWFARKRPDGLPAPPLSPSQPPPTASGPSPPSPAPTSPGTTPATPQASGTTSPNTNAPPPQLSPGSIPNPSPHHSATTMISPDTPFSEDEDEPPRQPPSI